MTGFDKGLMAVDAVVVPVGTAKDGAKVFATNFWALLAANCTVPGMVTGGADD